MIAKHPTRSRQSSRRLARIFTALLAITIASCILTPELFTTGGMTWSLGNRKLLVGNLEKFRTTDVSDQLVAFNSNPDIESTIVFAYFELAKSKHSGEEYNEWLKFSLCIDDAAVIFTTPDMVEHMKELRSHASNRTLIIPMNVTDIEVGNDIHFDDQFWEDQILYETEGNRNRDPNLYKIWLAKTWLVNLAVDLNPFNSRLYTWLDAGYFRETNLHFCGKTVFRHPEIIPLDRIVLQTYRALKPEDEDKYKSKTLSGPGFSSFYIVGGAISGDKFAWPRYLKAIEKTIQTYSETENVGLKDDQPVMQSTCMQNKDLCLVVRRDAPYGTGGLDTCRYTIPECMENGGWLDKTSLVNNFFAFKFRLWHGGDVETMYWEPFDGLPSKEENPSMYN